MLNNISDGDWVYCTKCPDNKRPGDKRIKVLKIEVERSQWDKWTCANCRSQSIGLELIDFIKTRIQATASEDESKEEVQIKFIFREILQNSDDAKSSILVLRFNKDALYIANDGRAFTTEPDGDFDRISRILGRHQAEDKETVGHFGSGFQTVYAITNKPEVHSNGISGQMNPSLSRWNHDIQKKTSPFKHQESKGVLFRLPWRDDEKANEKINDRIIFSDRTYWPRWNKKERRYFYDELKKYLHQAVLCCQNLSLIRIIWDENGLEGYQIKRHFSLKTPVEEITSMEYDTSYIEQGIIVPKKKFSEEDTYYHVDSWIWEKGKKQYHYLIGRNFVKNNQNNRIYYGRKWDDQITVTSDPSMLRTELYKGDIHLLFPLFDTSNEYLDGGTAFLYSVIPLPKKSKNVFSFSAHFPPTEDRRDVNIGGSANTEWYQRIVKNIASMYRELFQIFLSEIKKLDISNQDKQKIILDVLPRCLLPEWMRPDYGRLRGWWEEDNNKVIDFLKSTRIINFEDSWIQPSDSYWTNSALESHTLEILGYSVLSEAFKDHPCFNYLSPSLERRKITHRLFDDLWIKFYTENKDIQGNIFYNKLLPRGILLDKVNIQTLIKYCITDAQWEGINDKSIIPGVDNILRPIFEYPLMHVELNDIHKILTEDLKIHDDFILELNDVLVDERTSGYDEILEILSSLIEENQDRYGVLDHEDHILISNVVKSIILNNEFSLREEMKNYSFIPYIKEVKTSIGKPNVGYKNDRISLISHTNFPRHEAENLLRDSIFGVQKIVIPGLIREINDKIKYINFIGCTEKELEEIENKLYINKLCEQVNTPLNFIRHFISRRHGSLFEDHNLKHYTQISDDDRILTIKKALLETLKTYFDSPKTEQYLTPRDMSLVPCLYDENSIWHNAGDFALEIDPELDMLGYRALHPELKKWPEKTLFALGVTKVPEPEQIVKTIKELIEDKQGNRDKISNIISWLLSEIQIEITMEFDELQNIEWIPIINNGFCRPGDVIAPTDKNLDLVGLDFPNLLDITSSSQHFQEQAMELMKDKIDEKKYLQIGLKTEPDLLDLLRVIEQKRENNVKPPDQLFNKINSILNQGITIEKSSGYGYYHNEKWIDSKTICIIEMKYIPAEIKEEITAISPDSKHRNYLKFDGASTGLSPEYIFSLIADKKIIPTQKLWDTLTFYTDDIDEYYKEKFSNQEIYPINDTGDIIAPDKIILSYDTDGFFSESTEVGDLQFLDLTSSKRHGKILEKIGALTIDDLGIEGLIGLIRHYQRKPKYDLVPDECMIILHLLQRISEKDPECILPSEPIWPVNNAGVLFLKKINECFIPDDPLSEHFEDFVYYPITRNYDGYRFSLQDFALNNGCKKLSENIIVDTEYNMEYKRPDVGNTHILNECFKALKINFSFLKESEYCFDWLQNIKSYIPERLESYYKIKKRAQRIIIKRYALIRKPNDVYEAYLQYPRIVMHDELVDEITRISLIEGFPDNEKHKKDLEKVTDTILHYDPIHWSEIIKKYEYDGVGYVSTWGYADEGGRGYLSTRETLQEWYGCCQICYNTTPSDDKGLETLERVNSIVSQKGGRHPGKRDNYSTANCLLLCPRHQALYQRGLVRFSELDPKSDYKFEYDIAIEALNEKIDVAVQQYEEDSSYEVSWPSLVYQSEEVFTMIDGTPLKNKENLKSSWQKKSIVFNIEHLVNFLKNMRTYFQYQKGNKE